MQKLNELIISLAIRTFYLQCKRDRDVLDKETGGTR